MTTKTATRNEPPDTSATTLLAPGAVSLGTLTATSPGALIAGASEMASTLAEVIRSKHLAKTISGREYVYVEGWTTLATMLGVTAREVSTVDSNGIYVAVVELARMSDGAIISRASAECGEETPWCNRPRYARRSMAQTRATGKACRLAFSWIMKLAGYEPTPAEEMPADSDGHAQTSPHQSAPAATRQPGQTPGAAPSAPETINDAQHRLLEARIGELGLDRERVKAWTGRAWGVHHLDAIPTAKFSELLDRLEMWAEDAAEAAAERAAIQGESA